MRSVAVPPSVLQAARSFARAYAEEQARPAPQRAPARRQLVAVGGVFSLVALVALVTLGACSGSEETAPRALLGVEAPAAVFSAARPGEERASANGALVAGWNPDSRFAALGDAAHLPDSICQIPSSIAAAEKH